MLVPLELKLTPADEIILMDNVSGTEGLLCAVCWQVVLSMNGFEFDIDEEGIPGKRVKLVACPFSKGTEFGARGMILE